jgi:hypothetical protein
MQRQVALEPRLDAVLARLHTLPGVTSVAITNALPASGDGGWNGASR